jgi:hypothetical protein
MEAALKARDIGEDYAMQITAEITRLRFLNAGCLLVLISAGSELVSGDVCFYH